MRIYLSPEKTHGWSGVGTIIVFSNPAALNDFHRKRPNQGYYSHALCNGLSPPHVVFIHSDDAVTAGVVRRYLEQR